MPGYYWITQHVKIKAIITWNSVMGSHDDKQQRSVLQYPMGYNAVWVTIQCGLQ